MLCNGTLMRLATGFWSSLASSALESLWASTRTETIRDQAIWTFQNRGAMNFKMPWTFLRNAVGSKYSPHGT